ncbi:hypothetical protein [Diaphorobacter caeni]|uniref:hypothetical protein n=1 Tax=Diaphorobacter caeni TaxID=2784387 RepID=UPI00188E3A74|nr:hypothetical protein [Diaphorobacter caeni]MBF5006953.1 hypothetical protein [Diaphorobacter caeni]
MESFLKSLSDEQKKVFDDILLLTVDSVIFRVLRLADQGVLTIGYGDIENISEASDGLSGEIFGENGWIRSFSDFPPSMK